MRDSSCWIYDGVSVNPMYWPARRREALNLLAIYRYHPMFQDAEFQLVVPGVATRDFSMYPISAAASLEGGDVQPIGNGVVLIGMSERTQGRMIEQIARAFFAQGLAERVIACRHGQGPRPHAPGYRLHDARPRQGDALPEVVHQIRAISLRPGKKEGDFHVTVETDFLAPCRTRLGSRS